MSKMVFTRNQLSIGRSAMYKEPQSTIGQLLDNEFGNGIYIELILQQLDNYDFVNLCMINKQLYVGNIFDLQLREVKLLGIKWSLPYTHPERLSVQFEIDFVKQSVRAMEHFEWKKFRNECEYTTDEQQLMAKQQKFVNMKTERSNRVFKKISLLVEKKMNEFETKK
jgi:hypothetical protein